MVTQIDKKKMRLGERTKSVIVSGLDTVEQALLTPTLVLKSTNTALEETLYDSRTDSLRAKTTYYSVLQKSIKQLRDEGADDTAIAQLTGTV